MVTWRWPAEPLLSLSCPISLRCLLRDAPLQSSLNVWPQLCLGHTGFYSYHTYSHLLFFNFSEDWEWGILLSFKNPASPSWSNTPDACQAWQSIPICPSVPVTNIAAIQSSPIGIAYSLGILRLPLANAPSTLRNPVCISSEGLEFDSILKYPSAVWASVACMSHRHFKLKLHKLHMTGHPVTVPRGSRTNKAFWKSLQTSSIKEKINTLDKCEPVKDNNTSQRKD